MINFYLIYLTNSCSEGGRAGPSNPIIVQIEACSFQGVNNVRVARSVDNETVLLFINTFLLRPYHNFKMNMSHLIPEIKDRDLFIKKFNCIKQTQSEFRCLVFKYRTIKKLLEKIKLHNLWRGFYG